MHMWREGNKKWCIVHNHKNNPIECADHIWHISDSVFPVSYIYIAANSTSVAT